MRRRRGFAPPGLLSQRWSFDSATAVLLYPDPIGGTPSVASVFQNRGRDRARPSNSEPDKHFCHPEPGQTARDFASASRVHPRQGSVHSRCEVPRRAPPARDDRDLERRAATERAQYFQFRRQHHQVGVTPGLESSFAFPAHRPVSPPPSARSTTRDIDPIKIDIQLKLACQNCVPFGDS